MVAHFSDFSLARNLITEAEQKSDGADEILRSHYKWNIAIVLGYVDDEEAYLAVKVHPFASNPPSYSNALGCIVDAIVKTKPLRAFILARKCPEQQFETFCDIADVLVNVPTEEASRLTENITRRQRWG